MLKCALAQLHRRFFLISDRPLGEVLQLIAEQIAADAEVFQRTDPVQMPIIVRRVSLTDRQAEIRRALLQHHARNQPGRIAGLSKNPVVNGSYDLSCLRPGRAPMPVGCSRLRDL
jgi:hypothetical protein